MQDLETMVEGLVDQDMLKLKTLINETLELLGEGLPASLYISKLCPAVILNIFELNVIAMCMATGAPRKAIQEALIDGVNAMLTSFAKDHPEEPE